MVGPFADQRRSRVGQFVIFAKLVGQAGVRIDHHQRVGEVGEHADMRAKLRRAERAVEPHCQRLRMTHRIPESLDRVARQVATRQVGERHRDHQRQLAPDLRLRLDRRGDPRLGIQCVEDRLDQDEIGSALGERDYLFAIDVLQFVEIDLAIARIVDVGRQRQRLVRRPDRARDEAAAAVLRRELVGRFAPQARAFVVDVSNQRFGAIIGLADPVRAEGVGRDDVRSGGEIGLADRGHDILPRQRKDVVITLLIVTEAERSRIIGFAELAELDLGAPAAIGEQDAILRRRDQGLAR